MQANTQTRRAAVRAAFPHTIPVLTGFLFLGAAYGILMNSKGFAFYWSILMSAATFAGSMQFVAINLLTSAFNPLAAFFLTLMVNARHLFYGVSMLEQYEKQGGRNGISSLACAMRRFQSYVLQKSRRILTKIGFIFSSRCSTKATGCLARRSARCLAPCLAFLPRASIL